MIKFIPEVKNLIILHELKNSVYGTQSSKLIIILAQ